MYFGFWRSIFETPFLMNSSAYKVASFFAAGYQPSADHILDPFEIFGSMAGWLDGSIVPWFHGDL